jgi:NAD(P)-dependent dehydrogenase (short-subunit alcohol dehydrogenase family)
MKKWSPEQIPDQKGKVAVVTGANSGLGYHTALELARHGAQVVLACRSREKTEAALKEIKAEAPQAKAVFMPLDLADLKSVAQFAQSFQAQYKRLDILHNNAGVMALPLMRTAQGFEMQIGTNHFGHFALTARLWDVLRTTPGARIVNTASLAHMATLGMDLSDPNFERKRYWKFGAYAKSKLANLLFTYELDRRLRKQKTDAIAVAAHPGVAATNLPFVGPALENDKLTKWAMVIGAKVVAQSAEAGAWPQLYASTMPDVKGGEYFGPDGFREFKGYPKRVSSMRNSHNAEAAQRLWALSEELTETSFLS